jgi:hypothetical protein
MGQIWLTSLPDVLRNAGLDVGTYQGWEARARSTGGYDAILAVQVHHTASNSSPEGDMSYMWEGSPDRPVGAIYLARDGKVTVGAAGATNTSGKGGPLGTSGGEIPLDAANRYVISIEAANTGTGEPWPEAQQKAYVTMVQALCAAYGLTYDYGDVHAHFEWTTRKIDPAGESHYASGANKWNMDAFRQDVAANGPGIPPSPTGEVDMIAIDHKPNTPEWTALMVTGTHMAWIADGHADGVYRVAGVQRVTVGDEQLTGLIKSSQTTTDAPPTLSGSDRALWDQNRIK